jgi:uncharacterized protein YjbJ (UPF0337 family)
VSVLSSQHFLPTTFPKLSNTERPFVQDQPIIPTLSINISTDPSAMDVINSRRQCMLNKAEVKGKVKQIKGAAKEKIGEVTHNPSLEAEGEAERREGVVQEKAGKMLRKAGKVIEKAGKTLGRK